jgi:hypothetical protein
MNVLVCVPLKVYVGTFVVGSTETPIGCTLETNLPNKLRNFYV